MDDRASEHGVLVRHRKKTRVNVGGAKWALIINDAVTILNLGLGNGAINPGWFLARELRSDMRVAPLLRCLEYVWSSALSAFGACTRAAEPQQLEQNDRDFHVSRHRLAQVRAIGQKNAKCGMGLWREENPKRKACFPARRNSNEIRILLACLKPTTTTRRKRAVMGRRRCRQSRESVKPTAAVLVPASCLSIT